MIITDLLIYIEIWFSFNDKFCHIRYLIPWKRTYNSSRNFVYNGKRAEMVLRMLGFEFQLAGKVSAYVSAFNLRWIALVIQIKRKRRISATQPQ